MKTVLSIILLFAIIPVNGQVQLSSDSSWVEDGALVLRVKIMNPQADPVTIVIDNRRSLRQLDKSHASSDSLSEVPLSFVVFYKKKEFIDEQPLECDRQVPEREAVLIRGRGSYTMELKTRCLGETILTLLNSGIRLNYDLYLRYGYNGNMHTAKTGHVKLKIRKPRF